MFQLTHQWQELGMKAEILYVFNVRLLVHEVSTYAKMKSSVLIRSHSDRVLGFEHDLRKQLDRETQVTLKWL